MNLRQYLDFHGMSVRDVAKEFEMNHSVLYNILYGVMPSLDTCVKLYFGSKTQIGFIDIWQEVNDIRTEKETLKKQMSSYQYLKKDFERSEEEIKKMNLKMNIVEEQKKSSLQEKYEGLQPDDS